MRECSGAATFIFSPVENYFQKWAESFGPNSEKHFRRDARQQGDTVTFLADRESDPPTNEWKGKTEDGISVWRQECSCRMRAARERHKK